MQDLSVKALYPSPHNNRTSFEVESLAASIKAQGLIEPIVVRKQPTKQGTYEIICGERRWRASQLAELDTIPAVIREVSDEVALALALIENIQRENLNPVEESMALKRLLDEFELTQQQVADAVGRVRDDEDACEQVGERVLGRDRVVLAEHGRPWRSS